ILPSNIPRAPYTPLFPSAAFGPLGGYLDTRFLRKLHKAREGCCHNRAAVNFDLFGGAQRGLCKRHSNAMVVMAVNRAAFNGLPRSEEHTSELQSRENLVC